MHLRLVSSFAALALLATVGCGPKRASITIGRMPEGGTFHGVWASPQYGRMHLCESNGVVVGEYTKDERLGTIQGRVNGDVLRFEWHERREMVVGRPTEQDGHGYFRLKIGEDGNQYLVGQWGHGSDEVGGGDWNGVKLPRDRPTDCYAHARDQGRRAQQQRQGSDENIRFSDEVEPSSDPSETAPAGN